MPGSMSTSIVAEGLDVDELGHVLVKLSDEPSEQWMEAFREYWADAGTSAGTAAKTDAFSHFSERTIVFRGIDVDGFVEFCKALTQDAIKFANARTLRFETEREARIRGRAESASAEQKHVDAERAKARKVKFD
jgi:pyridoxine/pyridoxamine 5'-phosphate oxidase